MAVDTEGFISYLKSYGLLQEYARRFLLSPKGKTDTIEEHIQFFTIVRAVYDVGSSSWRIQQESVKDGSIQLNYTFPNAISGQNKKHCTNRPPDRSKFCPRSCVHTCREGSECKSNFKPLWCSKCDCAVWCSVECKKENKKEHLELCKAGQVARVFMKFHRTCYNCGIPEGTRGIKLSACSRCRDHRYCSKQCQQIAWKDGLAICWF